MENDFLDGLEEIQDIDLNNEYWQNQVEDEIAVQISSGAGGVPFEMRVQGFIFAIREEVKKDEFVSDPSRKTVTKLIITLTERLLNPKTRKHVLSAILGVPVQTQNSLSQHVHNVLIEIIEKERYGGPILKAIEAFVVEGFVQRPWDAYPSEVPGPDVPDMRDEDSEPERSGSPRGADHEGPRNEVGQEGSDQQPV